MIGRLNDVLSPFFRDKRGVSEIVANLIILLIISVAGSGLYAYSLNAFSSSENSFQLQTSDREDRAQERLLITTVWWNITNDYMNVTVLNYGKIEVSIDTVYVDYTQVSTYTSGKGETITRGNIVSVEFTSSVPIVVGQTYEIIVVSERGSRDVLYWEA